MEMKPSREATFNETTKQWDLTITPPAWTGFGASHISLTKSQYERYQIWVAKEGLIQMMLPELTSAQREVLISGINSAAWNAAFGGDENE